MNIYDKKIIRCVSCNKTIGEIDYDAEVTYPQCAYCSDPKPYDRSEFRVKNTQYVYPQEVTQ